MVLNTKLPYVLEVVPEGPEHTLTLPGEAVYSNHVSIEDGNGDGDFVSMQTLPKRTRTATVCHAPSCSPLTTATVSDVSSQSLPSTEYSYPSIRLLMSLATPSQTTTRSPASMTYDETAPADTSDAALDEKHDALVHSHDVTGPTLPTPSMPNTSKRLRLPGTSPANDSVQLLVPDHPVAP